MPVNPDEVATAVAFLKQFRSTKRGSVNSRMLKQSAERFSAKNGGSACVSNGALIVAALELGLRVEEIPNCWTSPNALIGVSKRDHKKWRENHD